MPADFINSNFSSDSSFRRSYAAVVFHVLFDEAHPDVSNTIKSMFMITKVLMIFPSKRQQYLLNTFRLR